MTIANDNLPPVGTLQLLSQMKPAELRAELAQYKSRYGFAPQLIIGALEERDEWTKLVRAGMCFSYSQNIGAAAGFVSMHELLANALDANGNGNAMLIKRIYFETPAASLVSILKHGGIQGGGAQAPAAYNLRDGVFPTVDPNSKMAASNNLAGGPFGTVPVCNSYPTAAGVVNVIETPGAFLCEISNGDTLQIVNGTVNQALWCMVQYASVPVGGY